MAAALAIPTAAYYLATILFGADAAAKWFGQSREFGLQKEGLKLQDKQLMMQAALGRREERRADEMINRLLAYKGKERSEERADERLARMDARDSETTSMLMALLSGNLNTGRPQAPSAWPTESLVGTLRQ